MAKKLIDPDSVQAQVKDASRNLIFNASQPMPQGRPVASPPQAIAPLPDHVVRPQPPALAPLAAAAPPPAAVAPAVVAPAAVAAPAQYVRPSATDDPGLLDRNRPLSQRY